MNRREEIIFNTLKLASKNGLASVSMSQIAKETGIKKASLYNHFSSKDEIIEEILLLLLWLLFYLFHVLYCNTPM